MWHRLLRQSRVLSQLNALGVLVCLISCDKPHESSAVAPPSEASRVKASEVPAHELGDGEPRVIYVPAYSHLFAGANRRIMLNITLSVRNVDPKREVILRHVDYYDTPGHLVRRYLSAPEKLGPLGTKEYSVELFDDTGGSGANFLIGWQAPTKVHPLLAEAVMLGQTSSGSVAFTSRGIPLETDDALPLEESKRDAAPTTADGTGVPR